MPESLGLESKTVRLAPYDARWAALFREEAERITRVMAAAGLPPLRIEHVGSTAVPGLAAKPVLDLAAGRDAAVPAAVYVPVLERAGYIYRGESGVPGRDFFRLGTLRTHHLHLVEHEGEHWRRYIGLRDALRADPMFRHQYAAIKQELARRYPKDREAYTEGKSAFIEDVLRGAGVILRQDQNASGSDRSPQA